jgi:hypothetical protein
MEFLSTTAGQFAAWAAGLAGVIYLGTRLWAAAKVTRRISRAIANLAAIGDATEWPNGSTTLPESLVELYNRQGETLVATEDVRRQLHAHIQEFEDHISLHRRHP